MRQQRMLGPLGDQVDHAESPRIVEGDPRAQIVPQHDMVMAVQDSAVAVKAALDLLLDQHPPGHAQMQKQATAMLKIGKDVFRPPPQRDHPRPGQHLYKVRRQRPAQIGAAGLGPGDDMPLKMRLKAASDGFDLWQFWHFHPNHRMVRPRARPFGVARAAL